ncbi:Aldose 1-epimerase [Methylophaga frappieri]|uniref:Putative glucose-6-phosphate 1-epimerase n=1 Tax=Methylophaga frappieri (strain ATCC BAA-2434 / DSM 25690 / JAM7) TaxID=754477 RepID=I1YED9_METFJ|nr:D-hexose-6-phosphate mutarotase [Methylophaga frappieri]AFJ01282.1 Aldose 1-epimerase [Methylophaga frappieri]
MQDIDRLNQQFSLAEAVRFEMGPNGLIMIEITTPSASAKISLYGAQVLSYKPTHKEEFFYLSEQSVYGDAKAIRGGVPICWPWFGDDPSGQGRPAHGFARNQVWTVVDTHQKDTGEVAVKLQLTANAHSRQFWHCDFHLEMDIIVGASLTLRLTTTNTDKESFTISQALHSYFQIGDINNTQVRGFDNHHYLDKTLDFTEKLQQGNIRFVTETDRIYLHAPTYCFLEDSSLNRKLLIRSAGSQTTVVWNPWQKAISLADMANDDYQRFVCIETANAADDSVTLSPGESHQLVAEYLIQD